MRKLRAGPPSPALVVAALALVAAFAGTALAGPATTAKLDKKEKKQVKKLAKKQASKQIGARFPVDAGDIADGAVSADKLSAGVLGSAIAWAEVNSDGSLERSRGISSANVQQSGTAGYCFRNLDFEFQTALATPTHNGDAHEFGFPGAAVAATPNVGGLCSAVDNTELSVVTWFNGIGTTASSYSKQPFAIAFFN